MSDHTDPRRTSTENPDNLATPEGDNEAPPSDPLGGPVDDLEVPRGNAPSPYDADNPDSHPESEVEGEHKPTGIEKFIDEVARGEYM